MVVTTVFVTTLSALTTLTLALPTRRAIIFTRNIATQGNNNLCVVPAGNVVGNGTPVQLAPCTNGGSPWAYNDATGTFSLTGTNQCLDVTNGVNSDGTRLQTWGCNGGPNQNFTILGGQNAFHSIQWANSTRCLDVTNGVLSPGTPMQIFDCVGNSNQGFFFPGPPPIKFIATAHPTLCMNAGGSADGTSLQIATCASPTSSGQSIMAFAGGFLFFTNSVIDLTNGDQTNGNKLQIWTSSGNANQHWFYDAANKAIRLTANPNKCVDVTNGVFSAGTKLQIWDCNFGPNQQFTAVTT